MSDPFDGLEEWAKQAERRAKRADRRRRLGLMFRFRRPRPGLRRWRPPAIAWVAGIVIVVFLLAAAVQAYLPGGSPAGSSAGSSAYATQAVPSGVSATTSASAAPTDPFEGTPAATYPKGEAGITMPPATAVTGFTAAQVDAALQQVRKALVAGRLDQKMLVGHDPSTLLALLAPNPAKHVKAWFDDASFSSVATWIDPAAHLDPDEEVRVSGRVTLGSAVVEGIQTLQVTTNFVWVYAFTGNARNPWRPCTIRSAGTSRRPAACAPPTRACGSVTSTPTWPRSTAPRPARDCWPRSERAPALLPRTPATPRTRTPTCGPTTPWTSPTTATSPRLPQLREPDMDDIELRAVQDDDVETFFVHQQDPSAAAMAAMTPRDHAAFLAHWTRIRADPANVLRTVLAGGAVAGNVVSWEQSGQRLVGYWIGREHWGRGIATAALGRLLEVLPDRPVHAYVAVANAGSIRVLRKCGFHQAGPPVTADDGIAELLFTLG
ncbi:GNAT family N-acetyltransferase [Dactylosporangium cerinum]